MSAGGDFGNPLRKFKLVFLGEQSGESPGLPHTGVAGRAPPSPPKPPRTRLCGAGVAPEGIPHPHPLWGLYCAITPLYEEKRGFSALLCGVGGLSRGVRLPLAVAAPWVTGRFK